LEQKLKNFCHRLVFFMMMTGTTTMETPTLATPPLPPLSEVGQINIKFGEKFSTRLAAFPGSQFLAIEIGFYGAT